MQALKIGDFGLIPRVYQGVETRFHQRTRPTAQHSLFAEQVSLGLFAEGGLDNPRPCATNQIGISQGGSQGVAAGILVNCHQARRTHPVHIQLTHPVARRFGGHQAHVHVVGGDDLAVQDVEAVGEHEGFAGRHVGGNAFGVHLALGGVGQENHDDVGRRTRLIHGGHFQAVCFRFRPRFAPRIQSYHHIHTRIAQIQRMGVPLTAISNNGHRFVIQ